VKKIADKGTPRGKLGAFQGEKISLIPWTQRGGSGRGQKRGPRILVSQERASEGGGNKESPSHGEKGTLWEETREKNARCARSDKAQFPKSLISKGKKIPKGNGSRIRMQRVL